MSPPPVQILDPPLASNILAAYHPYRSFFTRGNSYLYFLEVTNFFQRLVSAICWK